MICCSKGKALIYSPSSGLGVPILFSLSIRKISDIRYMIDIFISLNFTEMLITVEPDIFQVLAGFWREFNGLHQISSYLL